MVFKWWLTRCFCAFILLAASQSTIAQVPVANFTSNTTKGCSPLVVSFTDQSTGNPKFWNWDLGNGQLSNLQNPTAVYSTPGTYSITLIVRNANGTNGITKTDYITVYPSPSASFSSDKTIACLPATVQFTDRSVDNVGTIIKWDWDFGDGTSSTVQNPQKVYSSTGFFSVSLVVTSNTGCTGSVGVFRQIRVVSGVTPDFVQQIDSVCRAPFGVTFSDQTAGPGRLTYNWDFGNGNTSGVQNPSTVFAAPGTYNVTLNVSSEYGCGNSVTKPVQITGATTQFNSPDSACLNQVVNFTNTSTPAPQKAIWDFGDGKGSSLINASKSYSAPGIYNVTLKNTYSFCSDSVTRQLRVLDTPSVDFSGTNLLACKGPLTVSFNDLSPAASAWLWDFGDGGTSNLKNPTHTYLSNGSYDVKLTITTAFGCSNTIIKKAFVKVLKPLISFTNMPSGGCVPYSFTPAYNISSVEPVTSYTWDFGDGGTASGPTPSHTYTDSGTYNVTLTITTSGGCTETLTANSGVRVGTVPFVDFSVDTTATCANGQIKFTDLSNPVDQWLWDFGDSTFATIKNPVHNYKDTGYFNITLTAYNNGCSKTISKPALIRVLPPIPDFDFTVNCANKFNVAFNNLSKVNAAYGPVTYHWNFGTGNAADTSNLANPSFTYPALGIYSVSLTVINGSCSNTFSKSLQLVSEFANFTASKQNACRNEMITFTATGSNPANIASYEWTFTGTAPTLAGRNYNISFGTNGTYSAQLKITDRNGCSDTKLINNYISVSGPTADFLPIDTGGCKNSTIRFKDLSSPAASITQWKFDFGDGQTGTFTSAPFTHKYTDTGYFPVSLTVKDNLGCTDIKSLSPVIRITSPQAKFSAAATLFCNGPLQFTDSSRGYITSYQWLFGDGTTSNLQNPLHTYSGRDSVYNVTLIIRDTVGCMDTTVKSKYITIKSPKAAFDAVDTAAICPPLETKFTLRASDYESFYWEFGDGQTSTQKNPKHFYNVYGSYDAKLYVVGYGGCLDSIVKKINVYNPFATQITYSPLEACNELTVDFTIDPPPNTKYIFYFGDGKADSTHQTSFSHLYNSPSFYGPYLMLTDSLDCRIPVGGPNVIKIYGAEPFFGVDHKTFCDSGTVFFTNYTIANDAIVSSTWDFGDGSSSNNKDVVHSYTSPGTYVASLTATTERGCAKTLYDTIKISATPTPVITSPDLVCIGAPIMFNGSTIIADTAITWNWSLGNGSSSTKQNASTTYVTAGKPTITLEAANFLGCKSSIAKQVTVAPLPQINIAADPTIISGTGTLMPVTYSSNVVSYTWTPPKSLSCTDCPNPFANPAFTTRYKVAVTDNNGCANSRDITVTVECNNNNYFIPNTFSPNADGINDVFYPRGTGINRIASMRIFTRWGDLVYEKKDFPANDASVGWNGMFRGKPAGQDVYVYVIEFICENAQIIPYRGNIALIR